MATVAKPPLQPPAEMCQNWKYPVDIIFVGNPGVGKSTLLRSISGLDFKGGFNAGTGLTQRLDFKTLPCCPKLRFADTPGLADVKFKKQAAAAITQAFRNAMDEKHEVKLVYVMTQQTGRISTDDILSLKTICDSVKLSGGESMCNKFGIIINKVPVKQMQTRLNADTSEGQTNRQLQQRALFDTAGVSTAAVLYLPSTDELDGEANTVLPGSVSDAVAKFVLETVQSATLVEVQDIPETDQPMVQELEQQTAQQQKAFKRQLRTQQRDTRDLLKEMRRKQVQELKSAW